MAWRTTSAVLVVLLAGCAVSVDRYPPAITSVRLNNENLSSLVVSPISDITISCQSEEGTPIYWSFPNQAVKLTISDGTLTIWKKEIDYNGPIVYNGEYFCFTNNTLGIAYSSRIQLRVGVLTLPTATDTVPTVPVSAKTGETVILSCRTISPVVLPPGSSEWEIPYIWYWQLPKAPGDTTFGRIDFSQMYTRTQGRISIDENNRLFIRNAQSSDFDSTTQQFIGCRANAANPIPEVDVGKYTLSVTGTQPSVLAPALIYRTSNVSVIEGSNFTLVCIFNDVNGAIEGNVVWSNAFYSSFESGARITVANAGQQHTGIWECNYKGIKGSISVFVRLYPRVTGIKDTFAMVGETVSLTCNYQNAGGITWYKNNEAVNPVLISRRSDNAQAMTILNVNKGDMAVYSCEVSNGVATIRLNGRLIVTDPTVGNVSVNVAGKSVGTQATVDANTTTIVLGCMFSADPLLVNPSIVWRMTRLAVDIDETTDVPQYGLPKGSVITQAATKQSSMTITVYGDSLQYIYGNVSCILKYKILKTDFRIASANIIEIVPKQDTPTVSSIVTRGEFPYWIIGVIIAALFLILLVFLIIFCVQRNKGEQYYVDEKERKAGHDPKEELPPWQEFNRPDQDPVKGSRASLEMEGDRPMGSDAGSMDEYGVDTDTGKFNEDGSFIGQYGQKGQRPGASGQV